jgi:hypothetical protein
VSIVKAGTVPRITAKGAEGVEKKLLRSLRSLR